MTDALSFSEDPALTSEEKEVTLRVNKQEQRVFVHSEIGSITKALLSRDDYEETDRRTVDGDVVATQGYLPMGVLKVQKNARQYGSFASIVSGGGEE